MRVLTLLGYSAVLLVACSVWDRADPRQEQQPQGICFTTIEAIETSDIDMLNRLGLPATLEQGLLMGSVTRQLCAADELAGTFVLTVERTSGQVVVVQNSPSADLVDPPAVVESALEAVGDRIGGFVVDGDAVVPIREAQNQADAVPIAKILG